MTIYDDMQKIATEILTDFDMTNGTVAYIAITPGNGPVDDPGPSIPTPYPLVGAARGVRYKYVVGGLALASDMQITIPVSEAFTPDMKGFIAIGNEQFKIVQCLPKPPVGTTVAYTIIFRK